MRTNLGTLELPDADLRAIAKDLGRRGGKASREDVKAWALKAIADKLSSLDFVPIATKPEPALQAVAYDDIDDSTVCDSCSRPKHQHMIGYCPSGRHTSTGSPIVGQPRFKRHKMRVTFTTAPPKPSEDTE